jgi:hypothetical protein
VLSRNKRKLTFDVWKGLNALSNAQAKKYGCEKCTTHDLSELEQVGKAEHSTVTGKDREVRKWYDCKTCGARWLHVVESGLGGHGDFWHLCDPAA